MFVEFENGIFEISGVCKPYKAVGGKWRLTFILKEHYTIEFGEVVARYETWVFDTEEEAWEHYKKVERLIPVFKKVKQK